MAITSTLGATISNTSTPGTTLTFASNVLTVGQVVVFAVSILSAGVSVSGITDTTNPATFRGAVNSSTNIRVELWTTTITTTTSARTFVVTFSGSTLGSAAYNEYAGATGFGTVGSVAFGSNFYPEADVLTQDTGNWSVAAIATANTSGDTYTADLGTIRRSLLPAATSAAVALVDNASTPIVTLRNGVQLNASRAWAAVAIELRTGVAATLLTSGNGVPTTPPNLSGVKHQIVRAAASTGVQLFMFAAQLKTGTLNIAYSETITIAGGTSPYTSVVTSGALPTSLSLNSSTAVISGTPSALGTFNFTVKVTDAVGNTASNSFQIIVSSSPGGNSGWIS